MSFQEILPHLHTTKPEPASPVKTHQPPAQPPAKHPTSRARSSNSEEAVSSVETRQMPAQPPAKHPTSRARSSNSEEAVSSVATRQTPAQPPVVLGAPIVQTQVPSRHCELYGNTPK